MVQFRRHSYDSSVVKKTIAALLEANCPAQGYPRHLSEAGGPDTAIIVTLHQPHASYCPDLVTGQPVFHGGHQVTAGCIPSFGYVLQTELKLKQPINSTQHNPTLPASFVF